MLLYISASWFNIWMVGLFVMISFFGLQSSTKMWMASRKRDGIQILYLVFVSLFYNL